MQPLVTVIIPSYNHSKYIKECIDSVYCQNYKNFELIVIDDASNDGSQDIISELSKKYNFIYYLNKNNIGVSGALNLGLKMANGIYVKCIASDDVLMNDYLTNCVTYFQNDMDCDILFTDLNIIDEESNIVGDLVCNLMKTELTFKKLVENNYIFAPSAIFKRSILDKLKGFKENAVFEDYDFWLRALSRGFKVCHINKRLTKYRTHEGSLGSSYKKTLINSYFIASHSKEYNMNIVETLEKAKAFVYRARLINKLIPNSKLLLTLIKKNPLISIIFIDVIFWFKIIFKINFPKVNE